MSPLERRIRAIPQRTMRDVWQEQRSGVGLGSVNRAGQSLTAREDTAGKKWVEKHVFRKPTGETQRTPRMIYEDEGSIKWEVEIVEDYNTKGDLGVILQFFGIDLGQELFLRGRGNYGPDSTAFYTPIEYRRKTHLLILVTRGDILETQVVPQRINETPIFCEETLIPPLLISYNPDSMAVFKKNNLVIVSYNPRPSGGSI